MFTERKSLTVAETSPSASLITEEATASPATLQVFDAVDPPAGQIVVENPTATTSVPTISPANPIILKEQLLDDNLLRLWRTGANCERYLPEEDGDVDVSSCCHCWIQHHSIILL